MKHFFTLICAYIGSALTCFSSQPATQGAPAIYVGMVNEGDTAYVARNIQDAVEPPTGEERLPAIERNQRNQLTGAS